MRVFARGLGALSLIALPYAVLVGLHKLSLAAYKGSPPHSRFW